MGCTVLSSAEGYFLVCMSLMDLFVMFVTSGVDLFQYGYIFNFLYHIFISLTPDFVLFVWVKALELAYRLCCVSFTFLLLCTQHYY